VSTIKVDGIAGDVNVQVRSKDARPVLDPDGAQEADELVKRTAGLNLNQPDRNIEEDFMA
jgi:hypothetical protein